MRPNETQSTAFAVPLSKKQQKAAVLIAEDAQSDHEIAASVGIGRATLDRWKHLEGFALEVSRIREEFRRVVMARHIARAEYRMEKLQKDFDRTEEIIRRRAADSETHPEAAGGRSGFIVRTRREVVAGSGEKAAPVILDEFAFDAALMRERRELLKAAAIAAGEWTEKHKHDVGFTPETARALFAQLSAEGASYDEADETPITG